LPKRNNMKCYIDQSGKVENTSKLTVVAYANGKVRSLKISAVEKRKLLAVMKKVDGLNTTYVYRIFAALVFLLIKGQRISDIVIDKEYPGHEGVIKNILKNLFERTGALFPEVIFFEITKTNPAHKAAISVYRGEKKPNLVVKTEDILNLFFGKKKGRRSHS